MADAADERAYGAFVRELTLARLRVFCVLVVTLVPLFAILDLAVHPSFAGRFLLVRIGMSVIGAILYVIARSERAARMAFGLSVALALEVAAGIEAMIVMLGPRESPYYAGLCLVVLTVGLLFPWTLRQMAAVSAAVLAIYLVPAYWDSIEASWRTFLNNIYFLSATVLITATSSHFGSQLRKREFLGRRALEMQTSRFKQASEELQSSLDKLKELDRLKSEFFANISHELRTPLTLILAPIEELLADPDASGRREVLLVVRRNAQRLLRLIEDLLDLGRLDARGLRLRIGPLDIAALVRNVVESCAPAATAKSIRLTLDAPTTSAPPLHGDPHRVEIVMTNLIGNALKFTPNGGTIAVRIKYAEGGAAVEVADNGPGIAPSEHERIFERFYQVEGSPRRRHGGAGIGLALARELVELHGGALTVESELGKGATFRMWLPSGADHFRAEVVERRRVVVDTDERRRAEDRTPATLLPAVFASSGPSQIVSTMLPAGAEGSGRSHSSLPPLASALAESPHEAAQAAELERLLSDSARKPRILLAEDEQDLRDFVRAVLERYFEVIVAADGYEALELARRERPDLVLSDVMMPGMSGVDLCRALRDDRSLGSTPIILLTSRTGTEAMLEGYGAGADDYVLKPFHARLLIARVRAQLKIRALGLRLASQARLATAGTLAAGVAHEVRNPLNALVNATAVLRGSESEPVVRRQMLDVVSDAADRIQQILGALDDQVRPADGVEVSLVDVRVGLDATLKLLGHRLEGIVVHRRYTTERRAIASARELNQVFLNLLDNAIRVAPHNVWIDVSETGAGVRICIADDGPGVPDEIAQRIFDPFFTTRPVGEGTGLGLYISRKLVKARGGELKLRHRNGGGAEFVVEMPGAASS